jgi:hypothetical protein
MPMNALFAQATQSIPEIFEKLHASPPLEKWAVASQRNLAGVYVFSENGQPIHVGRTRNLQGRLRAHVSNSHNSASFAFKRARRALDLAASYKTKGSRAALMQDAAFRQEFDRHRHSIKYCVVRFLEVKDPVLQYLLELYAHIEYGLPLDEFDTH